MSQGEVLFSAQAQQEHYFVGTAPGHGQSPCYSALATTGTPPPFDEPCQCDGRGLKRSPHGICDNELHLVRERQEFSEMLRENLALLDADVAEWGVW